MDLHVLLVLLPPAPLLPLHVEVNRKEAVLERDTSHRTRAGGLSRWNTHKPSPVLLLLLL
jgi:hypothetical protein